MSKSIFKSKVFWFNVLSGAGTYLGYLPKDVAVIAVPVINLFLRYLTTVPVSVP